MNGLWKEELSGWNHKNSRRKKRIRKHHIRDKYKLIIKSINYEYLYGKAPYQSNRSVKFAQKMIHRQVRVSLREWINKADWEKERKALSYEKSLAWYLD